MVKSKSVSDITDIETVNSHKWTSDNIEHVAQFVPLKNYIKCITMHTFPVSLLTDTDETALDMGVCLSDPEGFIDELENNKTSIFRENVNLNINSRRGSRNRNNNNNK